MKLELAKLLSADMPLATLGDRPVSIEKLSLVETPGRPFTAILRTRLIDAVPGQNLVVKSAVGSFSGTIAIVCEDITPEGGAVNLTATSDSCDLEVPETVCHAEKSRDALLNALAPPNHADAGAGAELHDQFVLVDARCRIPAMRLAMFGRLILLSTESGMIHVDPTQRKSVQSVTRFEQLHRERVGVPRMRFTAPDWDNPGKRLEHLQAGSCSKAPAISAFFPEAVSVGELQAAARMIEAIEEIGDFTLSGGLALARIEPGGWIEAKQRAMLVTGRIRSWTRHGGWDVQLSGGYPWEVLLEPLPAATSDTGTVIDFHEKTGRLRVKLSSGVEVLAPWAVDRANAKEYAGGVPAKGDVGTVLFRYGSASHPIYLGSDVPAKLFEKEKFDHLLHLIRSGKFEERMLTNGDFSQSGKSMKSVFDDVVAEYDKYSAKSSHVEWEKK